MVAALRKPMAFITMAVIALARIQAEDNEHSTQQEVHRELKFFVHFKKNVGVKSFSELD